MPNTPKSMILVSGKPFIAWQLEWLGVQGVSDVVLSIGYRGEQIRSYVDDGKRFDLRVRYVDEGDRLLGTAGALRLASDSGALEERFFVLYGDSYLDVSLAEVWGRYESQKNEVLMTVYRNENEGEVSNVVFDGSLVTQYAKNSTQRPEDMIFVDYGLLVISRSTIEERVEADVEADLSKLLETLSADGNLGGYEVTARFFEIGSPQGLQALEGELSSRSSDADQTGI